MASTAPDYTREGNGLGRHQGSPGNSRFITQENQGEQPQETSVLFYEETSSQYKLNSEDELLSTEDQTTPLSSAHYYDIPEAFIFIDTPNDRPYENLPPVGNKQESGNQILAPQATNVSSTHLLCSPPPPNTENSPKRQPRIPRNTRNPLIPRTHSYENVCQAESVHSYENIPASISDRNGDQLQHLQPGGKNISPAQSNIPCSTDTWELIELRCKKAESELAQAKQEIQMLSSKLLQERDLNRELTKIEHKLREENQNLFEKLNKASCANELYEEETAPVCQVPVYEQIDSNPRELEEKILELHKSNHGLTQRLAHANLQLIMAQNKQQQTQEFERTVPHSKRFGVSCTLNSAGKHLRYQANNEETFSHNIEPWRVSRSKLEIEEEIASGAWGKVLKGKVEVAVKQLHKAISCKESTKRFRREMVILSQVRHPNLVQFIGVVFDDQAGRCELPGLIITELLDMNLRSAYEQNCLSGNQKLSIFKDVAKALKYLHEFVDPIIHRDVSAPNVLLEALPDGNWKGKLTDLGSANFAQAAKTLAEGAIVYAAPETFPTKYNPKEQTPKIDVYSYGVMLCEVTTDCLPEKSKFDSLLAKVSRICSPIHTLIKLCTNKEYRQRPDMATVLGQLEKIVT